ncbi:hypothetical protein ACIPUO_06310 [Pectobacterium carotovorum]|uniref:hypothetical protein n=1 Tax=Pectobacterium carotovorum TaxID=554 RepID=UPI003805BFD1
MESNIKYHIESINNKITESQRTDITQTQTDEQRRIAALELRVTMLESALAGTQAQAALDQAIIGDAAIKKASLY